MAQARATGSLAISDWEETPYEQLPDGTALARATSAAVLTGDIDGKGTCAWLLTYAPDGVPSFVGTQAFTGTVQGRAGTFVLQLDGTFADGVPTVRWSVMPGSGTGELAGISGTGGYGAETDETGAVVTLDFELG
jgi:hypothetical protein